MSTTIPLLGARQVGDSATLTYEARNAAGSLVDADVTVTVTRPDGTDPGPLLFHAGLGTWETTLLLDQAGQWRYRFVATGAISDAEAGVLLVEPAAAGDLYVMPDELRRLLVGAGEAAKLDDNLIVDACRDASRAIDDHCQRPGRRFWRDAAPTARRYRPQLADVLDVADIGAPAATVIVATDPAGDGSYSQAWAYGADFDLEPVDAELESAAYAYNVIRAVGSLRFPVRATGRPALRVTARHGWSQVPDPVRRAAKILAPRLYKRKDTPLGFQGFSDFGPMGMLRSDPDILRLLARYVVPTF